jgi:hypothetical protein
MIESAWFEHYTVAEKEAMANALSGLKALREDVAQWKARQN